MRNNKVEVIAAIDIGSNLIRMSIAQMDNNGEILVLDNLKKRTTIGRDTFSTGKIQVSSIHQTCDILKGFVKLMKDYHVKTYKAVTTSGIREAENGEYVLEQIKINTKLDIEVINNAQERFYMYKTIKRNLNGEYMSKKFGILVMHIGSGGVELSVFSKGTLKYVDYIKVGALRLRGMLSNLERKTMEFPNIMEEFIESRIEFLHKPFNELKIRYLIGLGGELKIILRVAKRYGCNGEKYVTRNHLSYLYNDIKEMTTEKIIKEYDIDRNDAEILLPSILLFYKILNMIEADGLYAPMLTLRDGIFAYMSDEKYNTKGKFESTNDILSSVWYLANNFSIDIIHCKYIEKISLDIFDQTVKLHKMGENERFYLRIACILHDVGKHVNHNQHDLHSYNIIKSQDIMGMSNYEVNIVASIAKYHDEIIPKPEDENYIHMSRSDRIKISKLSSILKLAEALDVSHKQKVDSLYICMKNKNLVFNIKSNTELLLEEWSFQEGAEFFNEVLGYKPIIVQG
jgi:exopolyphosphatase/guanosine-5'-triphosphate,3'-diphosphate pyrophosphatase